MCIPDGLALASSTRRQSVFYSQQLAGCIQQSGCSVFVTQLLEPGLSLQWHHLSLPYMSHHSCWTNCNSLTTLCPYFPHGSLQTPFKTLTASFPRSIFQPTLPPSTQNIFCTLLTFSVDSPPWPSSWEENLHPFRFQFPEADTYIAVPQTDATGVLVVLST